MTQEVVLSTIEMKGKDVVNAPFWAECYHKDEVTKEMLSNGKQWYEYHIRFDGSKAVMITKTNKIKKVKQVK